MAHFAPKQPVEKEVYPPKAKSWATGFLTHPSQTEINRSDNYIRALRKTPSGGTASGKRNDVAQLGQQSNKSIDPLIVLPSGHGSATDLLPLTFRENFAAEAGITLSQLDNEELPLTGGQDYWKWEYGKSLVPPDQIRSLPTCLRQLHSWYMKTSAKYTAYLINVKITKPHFTGQDMYTIQLEELWFLYNLNSLDLGLISAYCL